MLRLGLSGIMRVKNDAEFIEASIDSCIDALDELVIVYNGCTDHSPQLILQKQQQYPDKIKVYEYAPLVVANNLTEKEYQKALKLPDDSPHLLCNYYNFALSKATYAYAIKIDADQIYMRDQLLYWRNICLQNGKEKFSLKVLLGKCFHYYFLLYRFLGIKLGKQLPLLPRQLCLFIEPFYRKYAVYSFLQGKSAISLSGINVVYDASWYVPLGGVNSTMNILPPYNGEGDHLIFKISDLTYYRRYSMPYYNMLRSTNFSLIEEFVHPYKVVYMGFAWFHLNAMRSMYRDQVVELKKATPNKYMPLTDFLEISYSEVKEKADFQMHRLYQRLLFSYLHNASISSVKKYVGILNQMIK